MINYIKGDATDPIGDGKKIIAHICNDIGAWGAGFVLAISKKWSSPEQAYRQWKRSGVLFTLGQVRFVPVTDSITVANMIGQHGIKSNAMSPPIRYDAVRECLRQLALKATETQAAVHMPRIGCGRAGGEWGRIETLIQSTLCASGIEVFVYDFA